MFVAQEVGCCWLNGNDHDAALEGYFEVQALSGSCFVDIVQLSGRKAIQVGDEPV